MRRQRHKKRNSSKLGGRYLLLSTIFLVLIFAIWRVSDPQVLARYVDFSTIPNSRVAVGVNTDSPDRVLCSNIELPKVAGSMQGLALVCNDSGRYCLLYDSVYVATRWVAYTLAKQDISGVVGRSSSFSRDAQLVARFGVVASNADYSKSGFDRGHLLPSGDRTSSSGANKATFLLSNCAPQTPALNRGPWRELEEQIRREITGGADTIYIVVGPVALKDSDKRIGGAGVTVPEAFFKAIVILKNGEWSGMAYVMPNLTDGLRRVTDYRVTIDSAEALTGYDLFYNLPDTLENRIEGQ